MRILTRKYRLKGKRLGKKLRDQARAVNRVWNYCVSVQKEIDKRWKEGKRTKWPSFFDLTYLTAGTSKELGLYAQTIQWVCKQFVQSRDQHKKCPKFRRSYEPHRSLGWIPFSGTTCVFGSDCFSYLGRTYRIFGGDPFPEIIKSGHIVEDSLGRWYVCVRTVVVDDNTHGNKEIGVDLGLKDLVTTSEGVKYENPGFLRKSEQKLKVAQRANNKKKVKSLHTKIKNQRKDYLHKLSDKLVRESKLIIVGNVKAGLGLKSLRKAARDASWSGLREMLRYKASRHGVKYLETNEAFTTQTCSKCGQRPPSRPKGIAGLGIREWVCSLCGTRHDRDVNAAKNILVLGRGAAPPVEESLGADHGN